MFRFDKDGERIERQIQDWILCKVYIINRTWVTEMKMALMFHCGSCEKVFHKITITKVHITSLIVLLSMFSCVQKIKTAIAKLLLFKYVHLATIPILYISSNISIHPTKISECQLSFSVFTMRQLKILMSIVLNKFHHAATQYPGHGTKFVTLPSSILLY